MANKMLSAEDRSNYLEAFSESVLHQNWYPDSDPTATLSDMLLVGASAANAVVVFTPLLLDAPRDRAAVVEALQTTRKILGKNRSIGLVRCCDVLPYVPEVGSTMSGRTPTGADVVQKAAALREVLQKSERDPLSALFARSLLSELCERLGVFGRHAEDAATADARGDPEAGRWWADCDAFGWHSLLLLWQLSDSAGSGGAAFQFTDVFDQIFDKNFGERGGGSLRLALLMVHNFLDVMRRAHALESRAEIVQEIRRSSSAARGNGSRGASGGAGITLYFGEKELSSEELRRVEKLLEERRRALGRQRRNCSMRVLEQLNNYVVVFGDKHGK